ncbi:ATP-binding protein [Actinotalea sp.]|uniref:sensor histidine kinase n=1 Tax=Actinotalea sp. TaxID=1872145 RepID=UPI00356301AC
MNRWTRLPLRTQLTAVFSVLLLMGLGLTGLAAHALLERSLVAELDAQLESAGTALANQALRRDLSSSGQDDSVLPSDYQVVILDTSGEVVQRYAAAQAETTPSLSALTPDEVTALAQAPFTVGSVSGGTEWRALALPVFGRASGEVVGSAVVALPMTSAEATLRAMQIALLTIGLGVAALGAVAGTWGVRRSLRPLRTIEETAEAIAAGDLSRRVPDAAPGTEVGRLADSLNGMLTQIERAFEARTASEERMRRFVADASHELRTPLATIRGYGELYRMGALTGAQDVGETMKRIEDSATRMGSLVEDLLHLARLDEGRPLRHEHVDLAVLAADALADLRALDPSRAVRIVPTSPDAPPSASTTGDESRLRQVVANLVGNVVRHTPSGTPVEIAVGRLGDQSVIEVRDHGPGIAPEHAARVFERFYRVDAARGRATGGGAGLGMAIVAAIVDAHQGTVTVAQTPGGGTTIRVGLPVAPPAEEATPATEG